METKACKNCQKDFTIESDDFGFYEKIKVPPPTHCFECRMKRKMAWRNERVWYKRTCDATGKAILSIFNPKNPYKVYEQEYWKSDAWDPLTYGQEYDFSLGFFDQFDSLMKAVPHQNLITRNCVNSEYANYSTDGKNIYFSSSFVNAEDSAYLFGVVTDTKFSMDIHQSAGSEYSYELVDCTKSYNLFFSQNCEGCVSSYLLYDCRNCNNMVGCVGLRNKSYCIFNEQFTKEEYQKRFDEMKLDSREGLKNAREKFELLKKDIPRKFAVITKSNNAVGDDIINARNVYWGFYVRDDVDNIKYSFRVWKNTKDIYDGIILWNGAELCYENISVNAQRVHFSSLIWGGFDIQYSYNCFECNNVFGCVGLKKKSYCIFNKQYTKEEYEKLMNKIIEQMKEAGEYGEFFPARISPFSYNESIAQEYFPLSEVLAVTQGFKWAVLEEKKYIPTVLIANLPQTISEVDESILKEVIECAHKGQCEHGCTGAFRVTNFELSFYKKFNLPLPELCPFCRHWDRLIKKNPLNLWKRSCMCDIATHEHDGNCPNEFQTPYSPDRPEIIYCEKCYQQEIY
jgi:hypothetical protein